MNALLAAIVTWLALNFGLPANYVFPAIRFLPEKEIYQIRYGTTEPNFWPVTAMYEIRSQTILLPQSWTPTSPTDVSILVHEMVHHLQSKAGLKYACNEEREAVAYAAQGKWLNQFGMALQNEFHFNSFTLKILTSCHVP